MRGVVGMTGEVTLQGKVLPIGGVKQKVLAAHRAGLTEVILPARNGPDLEDVPEAVRDEMTFHLASEIGDVLPVALDARRRPHRQPPRPSYVMVARSWACNSPRTPSTSASSRTTPRRWSRSTATCSASTEAGTMPMPGGGMHRLMCGTSAIKIVAMKKPVECPRPRPAGIGGATGYRYWTMSVSNLAEIVAACEAAQVTVAVPITELMPGVSIAIVEDPDGNWVEFVQAG